MQRWMEIVLVEKIEPKWHISMIIVRWVHYICLMQELNRNQLLEIKPVNKIKVVHTFISLKVLYRNLLALEDDMLSDDANTELNQTRHL